jgi:uncharacterized protein
LLETAIEFSLYLWPLLLAASFFAGLVDAVAGGGGLIQVPALFAAYPEVHPATLLGTNKVSAIGGTINAARKYLRYVRLPWALIVPAIIAGFVGGFSVPVRLVFFPPSRCAKPFRSYYFFY